MRLHIGHVDTRYWWVEDMSMLCLDFFYRVIGDMGRMGVQLDGMIASLLHYAPSSLKGIEKSQFLNPSRTNSSLTIMQNDKRIIVGNLIGLMPSVC